MRSKYLVWLIGLGLLVMAFAIWEIAVPTGNGVRLPKYMSSPHGRE